MSLTTNPGVDVEQVIGFVSDHFRLVKSVEEHGPLCEFMLFRRLLTDAGIKLKHRAYEQRARNSIGQLTTIRTAGKIPPGSGPVFHVLFGSKTVEYLTLSQARLYCSLAIDREKTVRWAKKPPPTSAVARPDWRHLKKYSAPRTRTPLTAKLRFFVFRRDQFTCQYCGRSAPAVRLHVDHVTPVVSGGSNDPSNLRTSCRDCNLGKGVSRL